MRYMIVNTLATTIKSKLNTKIVDLIETTAALLFCVNILTLPDTEPHRHSKQ